MANTALVRQPLRAGPGVRPFQGKGHRPAVAGHDRERGNGGHRGGDEGGGAVTPAGGCGRPVSAEFHDKMASSQREMAMSSYE